LQLKLLNHGSEAAVFPYDISMEAVGFFTVADNVEKDRIERIVIQTGSSMLYTASRDFLMTISARGPWNTFMLPTINPSLLLQNVKVVASELQAEDVTTPKRVKKPAPKKAKLTTKTPAKRAAK